MKKIVVLIIMLVLVCTLTACDKDSETLEGKTGKYYYQLAYGADATLSRLNNFDDEKNEIVAITQQGGWYTIFYKDIE